MMRTSSVIEKSIRGFVLTVLGVLVLSAVASAMGVPPPSLSLFGQRPTAEVKQIVASLRAHPEQWTLEGPDTLTHENADGSGILIDVLDSHRVTAYVLSPDGSLYIPGLSDPFSFLRSANESYLYPVVEKIILARRAEREKDEHSYLEKAIDGVKD